MITKNSLFAVALLVAGLGWMDPLPIAAQTKGVDTAEGMSTEAGAVTFTTADGLVIHGAYFPGKENGPTLLFLHMLGRTHSDWKFLSESFQRAGYHTLAIDLRGHGDSTTVGENATPLSFKNFDDDDFAKMESDVATAVTWLRSQEGVDANAISIIGASIGANVALTYGAKDPNIRRVALLSPGLEYRGINGENGISAYGNRPLFMAVSREDSYSAKSVLVLDAMSSSETKKVKIYTGAGHGTRMLSREPSLETLLLSWVSGASDDAKRTISGPPTLPKKGQLGQ